MFLGTHTPRLDEKGRLFLPAKYRERMAGYTELWITGSREILRIV